MEKLRLLMEEVLVEYNLTLVVVVTKVVAVKKTAAEESQHMVVFVLIRILLFKWLMAVRRRLKRYNLVTILKVVRLQVYFNLKHLMKYMITKVLLLQVVTTLKKTVDLSWLKTVQYLSRLIRYQLYIH